jgi:ATP-dependent DNA helicase RecQ
MGQLFVAGQSLEQIAQHYDILPETVIQNLCRFLEAGGTLDPARVLAASCLPEPERARVLSAFERLGHGRLAPVYQALSGAVPYEELHLLRLHVLCRDHQ